MPYDSTGANDAFMNAILRRIGGGGSSGRNRMLGDNQLVTTESPQTSFPDLTTDAVDPGVYETAEPLQVPTGDEYKAAEQQWQDLADSYRPEDFTPAIYEGGLDKVSKQIMSGGTTGTVRGKNKSTFKPWAPS